MANDRKADGAMLQLTNQQIVPGLTETAYARIPIAFVIRNQRVGYSKPKSDFNVKPKGAEKENKEKTAVPTDGLEPWRNRFYRMLDVSTSVTAATT